jgi:hypothetical protein
MGCVRLCTSGLSDRGDNGGIDASFVSSTVRQYGGGGESGEETVMGLGERTNEAEKPGDIHFCAWR